MSEFMSIAEVEQLFNEESSALVDKFVVYNLPLMQAKNSQEQHIWKPGVYVFWHPDRGVIKVGRHLTNSRKRAFEHIRHNTAGLMAVLEDDPETRLLLFNVKDAVDKHWVAALEIFFEEELSPEVKSGRLG